MPQPPNPDPFKVECAFGFAPFNDSPDEISILFISNDPDVGIGWRMRTIEVDSNGKPMDVDEGPVTVNQVQKLILLRYENIILEVTKAVVESTIKEWPNAAERLVKQVTDRERPYVR